MRRIHPQLIPNAPPNSHPAQLTPHTSHWPWLDRSAGCAGLGGPNWGPGRARQGSCLGGRAGPSQASGFRFLAPGGRFLVPGFRVPGSGFPVFRFSSFPVSGFRFGHHEGPGFRFPVFRFSGFPVSGLRSPVSVFRFSGFRFSGFPVSGFRFPVWTS